MVTELQIMYRRAKKQGQKSIARFLVHVVIVA